MNQSLPSTDAQYAVEVPMAPFGPISHLPTAEQPSAIMDIEEVHQNTIGSIVEKLGGQVLDKNSNRVVVSVSDSMKNDVNALLSEYGYGELAQYDSRREHMDMQELMDLIGPEEEAEEWEAEM